MENTWVLLGAFQALFSINVFLGPYHAKRFIFNRVFKIPEWQWIVYLWGKRGSFPP